MKKTIFNVAAIAAVSVLLVSCSGDGDNTVENWFIALILIGCWLKG